MTSLFNSCSFILAFLAMFAAAARAQTPVGDLAKPPADAEHLIISSTGGKHGDSWIWQTPDGTRMGREGMKLRGKATAEKLTSLEIGNGDKKKTVIAWAISGLGNSPIPVWINANNKFFGLTVGISWLPDGYESEREKLQKAQGDALAARMPALA